MNRNPVSSVISWAGMAMMMVFLAGCGGGTTSTPAASRKSGRLQVTVKWPPYEPSASSGTTKRLGSQSGRLVAYNATSIVITVHDPTAPDGVQAFSVTRQDPAHTFALPVGSFIVDVQEFTDNSPVVLAEAHSTITILANTNTVLPVEPVTTIVSLKINAPGSSLRAGDTLQVTATPLNAAGAVVPVPVNSIMFGNDNAAVLSVDPQSGLVTANNFGDANITASLPLDAIGSFNSGATGLFGSAPLPVHVTVKISLSPNAATLAVQSTVGTGQAVQYSNTQQFTATAQGDSGSAGVTWSIDEPNGGTLTPVGGPLPVPNAIQYSAPNASGTFHVRATSKTDNATYAEATVTVIAGSLIVNAN